MWVGRFETEAAFEAYIDSGAFERDAGYEITRGLEPFHGFTDELGKLFESSAFEGPLRQRLESTVAGARPKPNAVLFEADFRFDPERVRGKTRPRLKFVGAFRKA